MHQLDHKGLTELRGRAINAVHGGWHMLDAHKRGGGSRKLDGPALGWIYNTVAMNNPLQLRFSFALWTAAEVATLINRSFKARLGRTSVSRLLNQLKLSVQ